MMARYRWAAIAAVSIWLTAPVPRLPGAIDGPAAPIRRHSGGVVFELGIVPDYLGADLNEFWLYRWDGEDQHWELAPFQVDERTERGRRWVALEDGQADSDDEFVALVRSLGARAPETAWPEAMQASFVRYDLKVTDPLDSGAESWLHLFRSPAEPQPVPTMVRYSQANRELWATDYRLVQARDFPGLETLELFGSGTDILDRTKLRVRIYAEVAPRLGPVPLPTVIFRASYTEESPEVIQNAPDFELRPVKQGPVRIVLEDDGSGFAYPDQVQLFAAFGRLDVPPIPPEVEQYLKRLELHARVTMDFTEQATVGRYADANRPAGVPIDGRPESIPERPISDWRQIDTPSGSIVLVVGRPVAMRELRTYYNDSGRDEPPGTGDNRALGENGVFTEDLKAVDRITDFIGWLVVLPPGSPILGPRIAQEVKHPLTVEAIRVVRSVPPTLQPTATDTPTALPSPVPDTPTAVVASPTTPITTTPCPLSLPYVERQPPVVPPKPTLCLPQAEVVDVALVIDTSTSMSEPAGDWPRSKLTAALEAARLFVDLLKAQDRVTVIGFNRLAMMLAPLTEDRAAIRSALARLPETQAAGTRIDLGILAAVGELAPSPRARRAMLLLTDGRQAGGGSVEAVWQAVALADQRGIERFTIALGDDADAALLETIASRPEYAYRAAGGEQLGAIYREIARLISCP